MGVGRSAQEAAVRPLIETATCRFVPVWQHLTVTAGRDSSVAALTATGKVLPPCALCNLVRGGSSTLGPFSRKSMMQQ